MVITALIMGGLSVMTLIITVGIVVTLRYDKEHDRETLILKQAHEVEVKQMELEARRLAVAAK